MKSMRNWLRKIALTTTVGGALAAALLFATDANAQGWGGHGYAGGAGSRHGHSGSPYGGSGYGGNYGYGGSASGDYGASGAHYHAPSLHYDRTYHADYKHWTPGRGVHTHGHYDTVPHYTPGYSHH